MRPGDDPISTYESLSARFAKLGPITFQWIGGEFDPPVRLHLRIVFYSAGEAEELVMEFDEVSLDKFTPGPFRDDWRLDIYSKREHGWERARYRVLDIDEEWLAFYCKDISVDVRPTGH